MWGEMGTHNGHVDGFSLVECERYEVALDSGFLTPALFYDRFYCQLGGDIHYVLRSHGWGTIRGRRLACRKAACVQ